MAQRRPASCRGEATRDAAWRGSLRIFPEAAGAGSPPEWLAEGLSGESAAAAKVCAPAASRADSDRCATRPAPGSRVSIASKASNAIAFKANSGTEAIGWVGA